MYRYTLTIPRETEAQLFQADEIRATLVSLFGGYTETHGYGGWRNDNGNLYTEAVAVWTVDALDADAWQKLERYAGWLAWKLGEECVYITRQPVETALVKPRPVR